VTLQNRVLPTGEIVADHARGLFTGNRGILHREDGTLGTARWRHRHWIACSLTCPRGRRHGPMPARGWTALFFLDEAVSLAAGHRPCAYCRRDDYRRFRAAWAAATGAGASAAEIDAALHRARVTRNRKHLRHDAEANGLPDGTFILHGGTPCLLLEGRILPFRPDGYGAGRERPGGRVTVLTPAPTVAALRNGYRPVFHPTAEIGLTAR
jgi:hypothetical protein